MSSAPTPANTETTELDLALEQFRVPLAFEGVGGVEFKVPETTKQALVVALNEAFAAQNLPPVAAPSSLPEQSFAKCFVPGWLDHNPSWGISLQLYELRSARNWGIGDFEDLAQVCELAAAHGASFVGLTPLHALFLADPQRCSPYSPSNRSFLNPLYIAADKLDYAPVPAELTEQIVSLRAAKTVDYDGVAKAKLVVLRQQWRAWGKREAAAGERASFEAFKSQGAADLFNHALFEALSFRMVEEGHGCGWKSWPESYQDHHGPAVDTFRRENAGEIEFHIWLQWISMRQLTDAANRGRQAGLQLGLYFDYAVGEDPDGSATWSNPADYLNGFSIGAPPDPFSESGQDWGLSVPSPSAFQGDARDRRKQQFQRIMTGGGMFRLDHVMGLWQLFAVPKGDEALNGAYLRYPIDQMLEILAECSQQNSTVVIGEDLGNVPPGFRELLESAAIFSYRVLYFEELADRFIDSLPKLGLVCVSTHDLYPLKGWWDDRDIDRRVELGLFSVESGQKEAEERLVRKQAILDALRQQKIIDRALPSDTTLSDDLVGHIHALLARSPCLLLAARLADLLGETEATNIPGTPADLNWRRKVDVPIEAWESHSLFSRVTKVLARERPRRS